MVKVNSAVENELYLTYLFQDTKRGNSHLMSYPTFLESIKISSVDFCVCVCVCKEAIPSAYIECLCVLFYSCISVFTRFDLECVDLFLRARESPLQVNIYAGHKKLNVLASTVLTVLGNCLFIEDL